MNRTFLLWMFFCLSCVDSQECSNPLPDGVAFRRFENRRVGVKAQKPGKKHVELDYCQCEQLCNENKKCWGFNYRASKRFCWLLTKKQDYLKLGSWYCPFCENARGFQVGIRTPPPQKSAAPSMAELWSWNTLPQTDSYKQAVHEFITLVLSWKTVDSIEDKIGKDFDQKLNSVASKFASVAAESEASGDHNTKFHAEYMQALRYFFSGNMKKVRTLLGKIKRESKYEQAAVARVLSYVHELDGDVDKALHLLDSSRNFDGPSNATYDVWVEQPRKQYYANLNTQSVYKKCLQKFVVFRVLWSQQCLYKGVEAWTPPANRHPGGALGFSVKAGADPEGYKAARDFFAKNGFVIMRDFLHPWEVHMLDSHFSQAVSKKIYDDHDPDLGRTPAYNDRIGVFLNSVVSPIIQQVIGYVVQPSYSFLCHYERYPGDTYNPMLRAHTDRTDNQYTVSATIYSEPRDTKWPVYVDTDILTPPASAWRERSPEKQTIEAQIPFGDAVLFRGRYHRHWRNHLTDEQQYVGSILTHFVDTDLDLHWLNTRKDKEEPWYNQ